MSLCVDLGGRRIIKKGGWGGGVGGVVGVGGMCGAVVGRGVGVKRRVAVNGDGGGGGFVRCFFKQKTAYEISECDWSSDVCSSD
eukprot:COSAG01_NODE_64055_length_278_cov_0.564246_1_plen_83_part_01